MSRIDRIQSSLGWRKLALTALLFLALGCYQPLHAQPSSADTPDAASDPTSGDQENPNQPRSGGAKQPGAEASRNLTLSSKHFQDPLTVPGQGGGSTLIKTVIGQIETPTGMCSGHTAPNPNHILELKTFFEYLSLQIRSANDTTLVIKGPGGIWCSDDVDGKSPAVAGEWLPGTYQIWVGSYTSGKLVPYELNITENR